MPRLNLGITGFGAQQADAGSGSSSHARRVSLTGVFSWNSTSVLIAIVWYKYCFTLTRFAVSFASCVFRINACDIYFFRVPFATAIGTGVPRCRSAIRNKTFTHVPIPASVNSWLHQLIKPTATWPFFYSLCFFHQYLFHTFSIRSQILRRPAESVAWTGATKIINQFE